MRLEQFERERHGTTVRSGLDKVAATVGVVYKCDRRRVFFTQPGFCMSEEIGGIKRFLVAGTMMS